MPKGCSVNVMSDDLTDKQKKRQIKRVHALLFDYQEECEEEGKSIVSLAEPYMSIFNRYFPVSASLNIIDLEHKQLYCLLQEMMLLWKNQYKFFQYHE